MTPTPSTPASTTSPGHSHSCGVLPAPTPSGVPVAMMSPGSSVMPGRDVGDQNRDVEDHVSGVGILLHDAVLGQPQPQLMRVGNSSAVTMQGPNGA